MCYFVVWITLSGRCDNRARTYRPLQETILDFPLRETILGNGSSIVSRRGRCAIASSGRSLRTMRQPSENVSSPPGRRYLTFPSGRRYLTSFSGDDPDYFSIFTSLKHFDQKTTLHAHLCFRHPGGLYWAYKLLRGRRYTGSSAYR